MYRMGTGDCFVIKFYKGDDVSFKMMIDCGCWNRKYLEVKPYVEDLKTWVGKKLDLLVITHEHLDHVFGFEACKDLFMQDFEIKETWMAWTENDEDPLVKEWMKSYGEKKLALAAAAQKIKDFVDDEHTEYELEHEKDASNILAARKHFSNKLSELANLQFSAVNGVYVGNLKGMKIAKEISKGKIRYMEPGQIIKELNGLPGVNFHILGPPKLWESIKKESGGDGESYPHNEELFHSDAFAAAVTRDLEKDIDLLPFDPEFAVENKSNLAEELRRNYKTDGTEWRNIDFDWLMSAGSLALRINSYTNNLSLAFAMEFTASKKVMLFPGDAEYGSWASWQNVKWPIDLSHLDGEDKKPKKTLAEDLLNRTVFYKVAHHISHNGTAKRVGLEMMKHPDLMAMATLDYDIISDGWKSTMPNGAIIDELVKRTKGRLMIMNETGLLADRDNKITVTQRIAKGQQYLSTKEKTKYNADRIVHPLYIQISIDI